MNQKDTVPWHLSIDRSLPCWEDYEEALDQLLAVQARGPALPTFSDLQSLLSPDVKNIQGNAIQFVSPASLPATAYEEQIFSTGRVSTRTNNWHDVFNALVWWRFPASKAAMNAAHIDEIQNQSGSRRGKLRDALTLWDECGVIVASSNRQVLEQLAERNWKGSFQESAQYWRDDIRVMVCGHALLEKFLHPYKSITAHAVLVQLDTTVMALGRTKLLSVLDIKLAAQLLGGDLIKSTADLSPLPLAGIPGWGQGNEQDDAFYADRQVFRKPRASRNPAPIFALNFS